jgi:hypothetical protein
MKVMSRGSISRLCVLAAGLMLVLSPLTLSARQESHRRGRKFKPPPPVSRITVTVLRNDNDSPINNAHVIFHPVEGDHDKGGMELKTNQDGVALMTVIPIGDTVLVQVIANGYQTYGGLYKVEKPTLALHIRMKLPGQQYSIYDNHDSADNSGNGAAKGSTGKSDKDDSAKDSGKDNSGNESKPTPDKPQSGPTEE